MSKDCMFQYYNGIKMVENTGLITLDEAKKMFNKYLSDFESELYINDPELCIWINCPDEATYIEKLIYLEESDCVVKDGKVYMRVGKFEIKEQQND